jgi:tetratricopeptide (TPR) repeat protein
MLKNFLFSVFAIGSLFGIKSTILNEIEKKSNPEKIVFDTDSVKTTEDMVEPDQEIEDDLVKDETKIIETLSTKSGLGGDVQLLFKEADSFTNEENYKDAIKKYNEIVNILKDTTDIKLLKDFTRASFLKAYIYRNYLKDDIEAIKAYDEVIIRFKDSENVELLTLYFNAQNNKVSLVDKDEAIYVYDEIIENFKNSTDREILKKYALAQNAKAYILEGEEKIEVYDEIIDKFKDTTDKELTEELMNAEFAKAYQLPNEEALEVYDDIIDRFDSSYDSELQDRVADALFYKSYLLDSSEESMEILNRIIDKYKDRDDKGSSKNFEYAVINNIELALVTNSDDDEYRELANQYLLDSPDTKPQIEMLDILKNAQDIDQDKEMEEWNERYKNYQFENWSFDTLKEWNEQMEDNQERERIEIYINQFAQHNPKN